MRDADFCGLKWKTHGSRQAEVSSALGIYSNRNKYRLNNFQNRRWRPLHSSSCVKWCLKLWILSLIIIVNGWYARSQFYLTSTKFHNYLCWITY
jgi:hypothetical protein